ncbi:hypothetical protein C8F04DRAFT_1255631 [Mycena alexandri]|uniref:Uncharacterized protein n=1 Tax=Mycena alexandri TaxID=1745969 RepID=A0AAD6X4I5_9AGAR|nr:hypothetical protein C8F04DRAFT_1255631 [Mycena alexandri]
MTMDLAIAFAFHADSLPLSHVVDFELDPNLSVPRYMGLYDWRAFLHTRYERRIVVASVYERLVPAASFCRRSDAHSEEPGALGLELVTALQSRKLRSRLHPKLKLVLSQGSITVEVVASLRNLSKVTWDDILNGPVDTSYSDYNKVDASESGGEEGDEGDGSEGSQGSGGDRLLDFGHLGH